MSGEGNRRKGGCLCGAVRFDVAVPEADYTICHCGMCRRWSAGPLMAVHCGGDIGFDEDRGLKWYRGSKWAERGFCAECGSSLFYRLAGHPEMFVAVSVDAFDDAADIKLKRHIYVDSAPDRYAFADDTPRVTEAELLAEFGIEAE